MAILLRAARMALWGYGRAEKHAMRMLYTNVHCWILLIAQRFVLSVSTLSSHVASCRDLIISSGSMFVSNKHRICGPIILSKSNSLPAIMSDLSVA